MSGIVFCVKYERNMRIHIVITIYVLFFAAAFYDFTRAEIILLILTCVSAVTLEMINTAIEVVIDKVFPNYHTLAKIGKDVAAGAVLIGTIAAAVIGVLLFWDTDVFLQMWFSFSRNTINALLLLFSIALAFLFICSGKKRKARIRKKVEENSEKK
jgi:diacylglycerol kinase (ATP)